MRRPACNGFVGGANRVESFRIVMDKYSELDFALDVLRMLVIVMKGLSKYFKLKALICSTILALCNHNAANATRVRMLGVANATILKHALTKTSKTAIVKTEICIRDAKRDRARGGASTATRRIQKFLGPTPSLSSRCAMSRTALPPNMEERAIRAF